jgi:hypothetical protein
MDVVTAFLNSPLTQIGNKEVLLELPPGCDELGLGSVVKVFRALYGLKQSPREWNKTLHDDLIKQGFIQSVADPCVYYKSDQIYVAVYVDDLFICGSSDSLITEFKDAMKSRYKMSDLGLLTWYLGMHFTQKDDAIYIDQAQYIASKLTEYDITRWGCSTPLEKDFQCFLDNDESENDHKFPYRSAVGSLIHLMRSTRPDIAVAVSVLSRYLDRPTKLHCDMVRRVYRYLMANHQFGLKYVQGDPICLIGYSDASYANSYDSRSMSGYGLLISNTLVSWYSHTQPVVALSTAEAEYIALTDIAKEIVWFKTFLNELGYPQDSVMVYEDNQAAIRIAKNPQDHKRTKHIQVRYHYVRDQVRDDIFKLQYIPTADQLADLFTKALTGPRLRNLRSRLGIQPIPVSEGQLNETDSN